MLCYPCVGTLQIDTKIPHQHTRLLGKPLTVSRGIKCPSDTGDLISISLICTARTFFRGNLEFSTNSCSVEGLLVATLVAMAPAAGHLPDRSSVLGVVLGDSPWLTIGAVYIL